MQRMQRNRAPAARSCRVTAYALHAGAQRNHAGETVQRVTSWPSEGARLCSAQGDCFLASARLARVSGEPKSAHLLMGARDRFLPGPGVTWPPSGSWPCYFSSRMLRRSTGLRRSGGVTWPPGHSAAGGPADPASALPAGSGEALAPERVATCAEKIFGKNSKIHGSISRFIRVIR
jgi:hypothetical protein